MTKSLNEAPDPIVLTGWARKAFIHIAFEKACRVYNDLDDGGVGTYDLDIANTMFAAATGGKAGDWIKEFPVAGYNF